MKPQKKRQSRTGRENQLSRYRAVFTEIHDRYLEVKSVVGTYSCGKFYANFGQAPGSNRPQGVIEATPSDFIADVELAARSVLNPKQYENFQAGILTEDMMNRVGAAFISRRIHPLARYLRPKDIR